MKSWKGECEISMECLRNGHVGTTDEWVFGVRAGREGQRFR